jgi:hypothetical protein
MVNEMDLLAYLSMYDCVLKQHYRSTFFIPRLLIYITVCSSRNTREVPLFCLGSSPSLCDGLGHGSFCSCVSFQEELDEDKICVACLLAH